jgi:DNA helicase HerA-like ATPase
LRESVEQVVRLIRSKGVGVYFCSQYPDDIPEKILGQLGHRVLHGLRAYTPRDQKALRAAAQTFAADPGFDVEEAIKGLGIGEAVVSTLLEGGVPSPADRVRISPPRCRIGAIDEQERRAVMAADPIGGKYDERVDRPSAAEMLAEEGPLHDLLWGNGRRQGMVEAMAKQAARSVGRQLGRQILRGLLGGISGRRGR